MPPHTCHSAHSRAHSGRRAARGRHCPCSWQPGGGCFRAPQLRGSPSLHPRRHGLHMPPAAPRPSAPSPCAGGGEVFSRNPLMS
ncbi:hypothetical protein F0U60_34110 [Archangium minus]|uniref:Uncharacterized protein n=1 Tax=Archangium minus TaxID=83450 RepID=A0ABY9WZK4_9BACT|nr:hypothetical protein F0U60_34110 [Archangium minus]